MMSGKFRAIFAAAGMAIPVLLTGAVPAQTPAAPALPQHRRLPSANPRVFRRQRRSWNG